MFSATQFDSTSAFSGGGFTSSQIADPSPSPAKSRETHGLVPVTLKQISEAYQSGDEKSNFEINGVDISNVTLVGLVFDKAERNTDVNFTLDDGTGRIGCRRWVNEIFDTREMEEVQDGMYVRVNGHLKIFQGNRQLVAFSVRPVIDFDEIAFHFIECIHNHLKSSKAQRGNDTTHPRAIESSLSTPVRSGSNVYQTAPSSQSCDQLVLDYLKQPSSIENEKGTHKDELSRQLKIPMEKIMEAIKVLEDEGLIYSTIDEFHYKSTV